MMKKKLDNRGAAAWEFILVFVPLFTLIFVIFDLGRYAITVQSLHALADSAARAAMLSCYSKDAIANKSSSIGTDCASACATVSTMPSWATSTVWTPVQNATPVLGTTPTICFSSSAGSSPLTVTASQTGFTMIMPIWPASFNAPNVKATTSIPF
jgi:Flp pilus assembly protein TadG